MANRRMFSKDIISSDSFLSMSATAQNLYFHLGMEADDDGFVPFTKVSKMLGTSHDDMAQLLGRGFLIQFPYGVFVIRDWLINNQIRKDRYTPTIYQKELSRLRTNTSNQYFIENNNSLFDNDNNNDNWQPHGNHLATQVSIGKDRLVKYSNISQQVGEPDTKKINEVNFLIGLFEKVNPSYKRLYANKTQRSALERMIKEHGEERLQEIIGKLPDIVTKPYAPKITTPVQLERDFGKLIIYIKQNQTSNNLKRGGVYVIEE